jgi:putative ABC transport system permease protein
LVVAVLVILGVIDQSFRRSAQGYNLIVGAKGSQLDLVLSTVYHIGRPTETVPMSVCDRLNTSTTYRNAIMVAVPLCMGDSFKGSYRVIGTTTAMFNRLQWYDGEKFRDYEWADGDNFADDKPFEAAVGAVVARKTGLKVGDTFKPVHGTDSEPGHEHGGFRVAGVLKPTGTAVDRAIFVNIEGFYGVHEEAEKGADHDHDAAAPEGHKVTAILVALNPELDPALSKGLPKIIALDTTLNVQAVNPTFEVTKLLEGIVGDVRLILLVLTVLIVVVAGIGVMVSIYNSMSDRRHEIAVIRALGAKRRTVMVIVLMESILLALGGGVIGLMLGHGLTWALSGTIEDQTGVAVSALQFQFNELILVPGLILLASAVGYMPAVVAYRTDVAQSLISSP